VLPPSARTLTLALAIAGLSSSPLASEPPLPVAARNYQLTDLGTLGGDASSASAIDEDGVVVGWSLTDAGAKRGFIWRAASGMEQLDTLQNGSYSSADGISHHGEWLAGNSGIRPDLDPQMYLDINQGFAWNDGTIQSVGAFYNPATPNRRFGTSEAHGANALGQIVGFSNVLRRNLQSALLWDNGVLNDIGQATETAANTRAFAINDRGQVVGDIIVDGVVDAAAFVWEQDAFQQLPNAAGFTASTAVAINEAGLIAGWSGDGSVTTAVLWSDGIAQDLGTLPGDASSRALALNEVGQVVGSSASDAGTRAFMWENGVMTDLNSLLPPDSPWRLTEANGINDDGSIVGAGLNDGEQRAFVLTPSAPTPEEPPPEPPPPFSCRPQGGI
jgi:probable HAF family extracellular repeat protein